MNLKNIIVAGTLSASALMGATAFANESAKTSELTNFYLQLNGGASLGLAPKQDFGSEKAGNSGLYGFEAGYQINESLRVSLGADYRNKYSFTEKEFDGLITANTNWKIKSLAVMANVYFDIIETNGFTPYVTLGAGIAKNTVTGTQTTTSIHNVTPSESVPKGTIYNFAYKAGLGTRYNFNQNIAIDIRYQFSNLGKIRTNTNESFPKPDKGKLRAHEFLLGILYKF